MPSPFSSILSIHTRTNNNHEIYRFITTYCDRFSNFAQICLFKLEYILILTLSLSLDRAWLIRRNTIERHFLDNIRVSRYDSWEEVGMITQSHIHTLCYVLGLYTRAVFAFSRFLPPSFCDYDMCTIRFMPYITNLLLERFEIR